MWKVAPVPAVALGGGGVGSAEHASGRAGAALGTTLSKVHEDVVDLVKRQKVRQLALEGCTHE